MNINYSSQNQGVVAWDGTSYPVDIRHHVHYSFTFQVDADLADDAVFHVQSAPPSAADPCVPDAFVPVEEVLTCVSYWGATPGPQASIMLPKDTKAGSVCTAALPCKPNAFVQLVSGSGPTASVKAVAVLSGPK
jgi:hypothetical protein